MINLSNSTPVSALGGTNVFFQQDASGNVSAYMPLGGLGVKTTLAPVSGVVTLDASVGCTFYITVNAAITSMVLNNGTDGQEITILWAQDATGHAVATSSHLLGPYSITATASKHSCYKFTYNAADTNWYQIGANNQ